MLSWRGVIGKSDPVTPLCVQTPSSLSLYFGAPKSKAYLGSNVASGLLSAGPCRLLGLPPLIVGIVHIHEHVPAGYACLQFGADEEGAGHFAVEGVCLLGWRGEAVAQHDGDEALNALGGALGAKVKWLRGGKGFPEDHYCLHMGILEGLVGSRKRY